MAKTKSEQQNTQMTVQPLPEAQMPEPQETKTSRHPVLETLREVMQQLEKEKPGTIRKLTGYVLMGTGLGGSVWMLTVFGGMGRHLLKT